MGSLFSKTFLFKKKKRGWGYSSITGPLPACARPWVQFPALQRERKNIVSDNLRFRSYSVLTPVMYTSKLNGLFSFCVFLCLLYFEEGIEAGSHCGLE